MSVALGSGCGSEEPLGDGDGGERVKCADLACEAEGRECVPHTLTKDAQCAEARSCQGKRTRPASQTADEECGCADGLIEKDGLCVEPGCGSKAYEATAADGSTICLPLTECDSNEYELAAPTTTSDRRCAPMTECGLNEYESVAPTATSDRLCAPMTACASTQVAYADVPEDGSALEDRICCHHATGNYDIEDGAGWPDFSESCLVVTGQLSFIGDESDEDRLVRVHGSIIIEEYRGEDFATLANLEEVSGNFGVYVSAFKSAAGLERLRRVGALDLAQNMAMVTLSGLDNLEIIEGLFHLQYSANLKTLEGLGGLRKVGSIECSQSGLESFAGLGPIETLEKLGIHQGGAFKSLEGLESLKTIEDSLYIESADFLEDLDALENLTTIGGDMTLAFNSNLSRIEGLSGLMSIGGDLEIRSNAALCQTDAEAFADRLGKPLDSVHSNGGACE